METSKKILRRIHRETAGTRDELTVAYVARGRQITMGLEAICGGANRAQKVFDQLMAEISAKGGFGEAKGFMLVVGCSKKYPYMMKEAKIIHYQIMNLIPTKPPVFSCISYQDSRLKNQLSVGLLLWEKPE